MGSATGVVGYGSLPEQIQFVGASSVAGTKPTTLGVPTLSPAVQSSSFNTGGIQRKGANVAMANIQAGAIVASGVFAVKVQHSNDDGVTDPYTDLAASAQGNINWTDIAGTAHAASVTASVGGAAANTDTQLVTDLRGAKLWVRYVYTLSSGTSVLLGASTLLGAYDTLPASGN